MFSKKLLEDIKALKEGWNKDYERYYRERWYEDTPGMIQLRKITKKYRLDTTLKTRSYTQGWMPILGFRKPVFN